MPRNSSTRVRSRPSTVSAPQPIEWAGFYAIDDGFWAAWLGPPIADPWRLPDSTGRGAPEDAERWIRSAKGPKALVRMMDPSWARAARRAANGKAPKYEAPKPGKVPPVYAAPSRSTTDDTHHRAHVYWAARDAYVGLGAEIPGWLLDVCGFSSPPPRPKDMGPEPTPPDWSSAVGVVGVVQRAFNALGIDIDTGEVDIGRAYRRTIAKHRIHPDQGGNVAAFHEVTRARDVALAHARGAL